MAPSFERPYAPGLACWFGWWVLRKVSEKVVGLCGQAILLGARRDVRRANPGWRRASVIGKGDYDDGQYRQSSTEQKNDRNAIKQIFKEASEYLARGKERRLLHPATRRANSTRSRSVETGCPPPPRSLRLSRRSHSAALPPTTTPHFPLAHECPNRDAQSRSARHHHPDSCYALLRRGSWLKPSTNPLSHRPRTHTVC